MLILFREFHDSLIFLLFVKKFLIKLNKKSADCNLKKDSPNIIRGFFAFKISFVISLLPSKISTRVFVFPSKVLYGYVRSPTSERDKIFVKLFTYDFLILAFKIVASNLGFVPIKKIKSDSSIPLIFELNK